MIGKKKVMYGIGIAMLLSAILFIWFALNNPQLSFPWSNGFTYSIYLIYIIVMVGCFLKAALGKNKRKM